MSIPAARILMTMLGASALPVHAVAGADSPPNVVIMYTDDLSVEDLATYGGAVLTPNIDELARRGARLDRYYATSPVCSPSRYSLLTGRYASRNVHLAESTPRDEPALIRWNTHLDGREETLAHWLKRAGYTTAIVGKHHNSIIDDELITRLPPEADARLDAHRGVLGQNQRAIAEMIQGSTGFEHALRVYGNNMHVLGLPEELQQHNPEWIVDGAIEFLDSVTTTPFFMYVAFTTPHGPDNVVSMRSDPTISPGGYLDQPPDVQPSRDSVFARVERAGLHENVAPLTWLDDSVGAVVDALDARGLGDSTLLIFASDHSAFAKMTCYERGARAPAVVVWPGVIPAGQRVDALTANIDWAPTVLAAAGTTVPENNRIDGVNLLPLLSEPGTPGRESLALEVVYTRAIVTQRWKYIATHFPSHVREKITPENRNRFNQEGLVSTADPIAGVVPARYGVSTKYPGYYDDEQLYDLNLDPDEQHNLAGEPSYKHVLVNLRNRLKQHQSDKTNPFGPVGDDERTEPMR